MLEDGEPDSDSYIIAYHNNMVVGARQYSGVYTDVPVMGFDGEDYSEGYIQDGMVPTFKLLKSDGSMIDLIGSIPTWHNNEIYMVNLGEESMMIPQDFTLNNPYPNPFNPITTISFGVPEDSHVSLEIFDINGRQVTTLMSDKLDAGYHEVHWDATSQSSGLYIIKMQSGRFVDTQKLMLIK